MSDRWIVIPNFGVYQHYKKPNPVWLRDYLRQLWNAQWSPLSLPQRGALWTSRLGYAHHNGIFTVSDLQSYVPKYERSHVPAITERLNQAGLLDLVSRQPLSLKALNPVHAREACPFCEVGAGRHAHDCPTLDHPELLVTHLLEGGRNA